MAGFSSKQTYNKTGLDVNDDISELSPKESHMRNSFSETNQNFTTFTYKSVPKSQPQSNFLGVSRLRKAPPPPVPSTAKPQIKHKKTPAITPTPTTTTTTELTHTNEKEKHTITSPPTSPKAHGLALPGQSTTAKGNRARRRAMFIDPSQIIDGLDNSKTPDGSSKAPPPSPTVHQQVEGVASDGAVAAYNNNNDDNNEDVVVGGAEEEYGCSAVLSAEKKSGSKGQLVSQHSEVSTLTSPRISLKKRLTRSIPQIQSSPPANQTPQIVVSPHMPKHKEAEFSILMPDDFDKIFDTNNDSLLSTSSNDSANGDDSSSLNNSTSNNVSSNGNTDKEAAAAAAAKSDSKNPVKK